MKETILLRMNCVNDEVCSFWTVCLIHECTKWKPAGCCPHSLEIAAVQRYIVCSARHYSLRELGLSCLLTFSCKQLHVKAFDGEIMMKDVRFLKLGVHLVFVVGGK